MGRITRLGCPSVRLSVSYGPATRKRKDVKKLERTLFLTARVTMVY